MKQLEPLTGQEKALIVGLISRVLGSVDPQFTARDDYYRDVLERVAEGLQDPLRFDVAPYMVRKWVQEVAEEQAKKAGGSR
jgi:hypothetical protein